ncbi:MAG: alpha/beta fold hydrolase, partial [Pseudomonadota bacterium]
MTTPILLIHGLFGSLSDAHIVAAFGATPVLAPDLLGYGEYRSADTDGLTLEAQADHVAAWLRQRGDAAAHVVGHSVGGAVAMCFASRHPELTRSLTSIEGNFTLKDAFWSSQIAQMALPEVQAI